MPCSVLHPHALKPHPNPKPTRPQTRRYAGLFFTLCVDINDNELACLETIHLFVEVLDQVPNPQALQSLTRKPAHSYN